MSLRYARMLIFWGVIFVVSLFLIFSSLVGDFPLGLGGSDDPAGPTEPEREETDWNLILGIITAVASGAGFVTTTIFALRDDRRETALHELQIENLKQEIEQKDLEIEKLQQEQELYDSING